MQFAKMHKPTIRWITFLKWSYKVCLAKLLVNCNNLLCISKFLCGVLSIIYLLTQTFKQTQTQKINNKNAVKMPKYFKSFEQKINMLHKVQARIQIDSSNQATSFTDRIRPTLNRRFNSLTLLA